MGWDITYHPFAAEEVRSAYFAGLQDEAEVERIAQKYNVVEFHRPNLANVFSYARKLDEATPFGVGHGFYLAAVAGHLRKYWYIRGSALSFLEETPEIRERFADWKNLVPPAYAHLRFDNVLTENYCGGVFITYENLKALREDYEKLPVVKNALDSLFDHGRMDVFMAVWDYALNNKLGLLEATEIVEPNPMDLNTSSSVSNLHNCDTAGAMLYQEAVMDQIAAIKKDNKEAQPSKEETTPKKGFFARLFGR